ncbi:MAG TPA: hypothetical protein VG960_08660 [Caulobacteraceae bacterium]|nr:hypothetical protein [Caulobacteraceae bacterium]
MGLGRALVAHNVKDCGYYSWKKGTDGKSVVVYCTNYPERHDRWSRYMVSVDSSRVIGPLKPWAGYRAPQP